MIVKYILKVNPIYIKTFVSDLMFNNNSTVNECNSSEVDNSSLASITITTNNKTINDYNKEGTTDSKFLFIKSNMFYTICTNKRSNNNVW